MSAIQIVCDNCGAKYRLPETSTAAKAKCKQCGSAIDVAAQRAAAEAPAPEPVAAARPARSTASAPSARSTGGARSARAGAAAGGSRAASSRKHREVADDDGAPPKSNAPLIIGGIGGVAVLIVVAVFAFGGKKKEPEKSVTAQTPAAAAPKPAANDASKAAIAPSDAGARKRVLAEEAPPPLAGAPAVAPAAQSPQGQPAPQPTKPLGTVPASGAPGTRPPLDAIDAERERLVMKDLEAWKKLQVKSMDQVVDPKTRRPAIDVSTIDAATLAKMGELLETVKSDSGRPGKRALQAIQKMGQPAVLFLINTLREVDYKTMEGTVFAYQINMALTDLTLGANTGFVPVDTEDAIDPRKAQWNASTVENWIDGAKLHWATPEKFEEYLKKKRSKRDAELGELGAEPAKK